MVWPCETRQKPQVNIKEKVVCLCSASSLCGATQSFNNESVSC